MLEKIQPKLPDRRVQPRRPHAQPTQCANPRPRTFAIEIKPDWAGVVVRCVDVKVGEWMQKANWTGLGVVLAFMPGSAGRHHKGCAHEGACSTAGEPEDAMGVQRKRGQPRDYELAASGDQGPFHVAYRRTYYGHGRCRDGEITVEQSGLTRRRAVRWVLPSRRRLSGARQHPVVCQE